MNPQSSSPVVNDRLYAETLRPQLDATNPAKQSDAAEDPPPEKGTQLSEVVNLATQLNPPDKLLCIRQLITQLKPSQIQAIVEFGQKVLTEPERYKTVLLNHRETCLILKKDYTYQERGLSEPTQYYVYLRRRKPKLDRYIGTLFYLSQGCALSYISDAEGRILFQPPHNVFCLTDAKDPSTTQLVRLIGLEPPPANYTFTKQQVDTPQITLQVEYLESVSMRVTERRALPFPSCMHEGGKLDRYRWDVSVFQPLIPTELIPTPPVSIETSSNSESIPPQMTIESNRDAPPSPTKSPQVLQLPSIKSSTYYLIDSAAIDQVVERIRLWVSWSEKAIPQAKWTITQTETTYTLMSTNFKRSILSVTTEPASVVLNGSLPIVVKWFHDLSLAVSQSQSQHRYSFAQLKLAHNLFVEMSLPQKDPVLLLNKLFDTEFAQTSPSNNLKP
jgi:hypothetical protein